MTEEIRGDAPSPTQEHQWPARVSSGEYSIGSGVLPGLSKLIEEAGEVAQVCGKIMGAGGLVIHWDGSDLGERLEDEMADLWAALIFVRERNNLNADRIHQRIVQKLRLFGQWHQAQALTSARKDGSSPQSKAQNNE